MRSPGPTKPRFSSTVRTARRWLGAVAVTAIVTGLTITLASAAEPAGDLSPPILSILWLWSGTQMSDGAAVTPDDRTRYTLALSPDGRVAVQADCNRGIGSYELDGKRIAIGPLGVTRAACPPGSLSDTFLAQLSVAAIYFVQDGDLYFDLPIDSGTMRFSAGS